MLVLFKQTAVQLDAKRMSNGGGEAKSKNIGWNLMLFSTFHLTYLISSAGDCWAPMTSIPSSFWDWAVPTELQLLSSWEINGWCKQMEELPVPETLSPRRCSELEDLSISFATSIEPNCWESTVDGAPGFSCSSLCGLKKHWEDEELEELSWRVNWLLASFRASSFFKASLSLFSALFLYFVSSSSFLSSSSNCQQIT